MKFTRKELEMICFGLLLAEKELEDVNEEDSAEAGLLFKRIEDEIHNTKSTPDKEK